MPQYDLAGNPLPENSVVQPTPGGPPVRYDLAGNPLPAAPPPAPAGPLPGGVFPGPGTPFPAHGTPFPGAGGAGFGGSALAQRGNAGKLAVGIGLGVAAIVLLALIFILRAAKPVLVAAPTAYAPYAAVDKSFTCDQPTGWARTMTGVEGGNGATVVFKSGGARVLVGNDFVGSLSGDMITAANNQAPSVDPITGQPLPPPTPPVEKLHAEEAKHMADKYGDYDEQPMQPLQSPVGDARISEWTGTGGIMAGKLHGYRVTMLGTERRFIVVCQCPERNWAVLQPAFLRMIQSVAPGNG